MLVVSPGDYVKGAFPISWDPRRRQRGLSVARARARGDVNVVHVVGNATPASSLPRHPFLLWRNESKPRSRRRFLIPDVRHLDRPTDCWDPTEVESGVGVDEVRLRSPPTPTAVAATSTASRVGVVRVGVIVVGLAVLLSDLPMVNLHAVELDDVLPPHYVVYLLVELDDVLTPHYVVYLLDLKLLPFSMIGKEGNASIAGMADFEHDRCNRRNRTRWRYEGVGVAGGAPGCTLSTGS
jgi:hypothetical protein